MGRVWQIIMLYNKIVWFIKGCLITDWVVGVQKGQNTDYVIFERSLGSNLEKKSLLKCQFCKVLEKSSQNHYFAFTNRSDLVFKNELFWNEIITSTSKDRMILHSFGNFEFSCKFSCYIYNTHLGSLALQ